MKFSLKNKSKFLEHMHAVFVMTETTVISLALLQLTNQTIIGPAYLAQTVGMLSVMSFQTVGALLPISRMFFFDFVKVMIFTTPIAFGMSKVSVNAGRISMPFLVMFCSFILTWSPYIKSKNVAVAIFYLSIANSFAVPSTPWYTPPEVAAAATVGLGAAILATLLPSFCTGNIVTATTLYQRAYDIFLNYLLNILDTLMEMELNSEVLNSAEVHILLFKAQQIFPVVLSHFGAAERELRLACLHNKLEELLVDHHLTKADSLACLKCHIHFAVTNPSADLFKSYKEGFEHHPEVAKLFTYIKDAIMSRGKESDDLPPKLDKWRSQNICRDAAVASLLVYAESVRQKCESAPAPRCFSCRSIFRSLFGPLLDPVWGKCSSLADFHAAIKITIGMGIGTLWISVPKLVELSGGRGYWVGLNVAILFNANEDTGSFEKSMQRLAGNGLAIAFSLVVIDWFQVSSQGGLVGLVCAWSFVIIFLIRNPLQPYLSTNAAYVSAFRSPQTRPQLV